MTKIAKRYARALYSMGSSKSEKTTLLKDLEQFRTWMFGSTELKSLISNPLVPKDILVTVITAILDEAKASKTFKDSLLYIIERGRLSHLDNIIDAYTDFYNEEFGSETATIKCACALEKDDQALFKTYLETKFKKTIKTTFETDPSLIGGFQIFIGSYLMDTSIKTKLFTLRRTLKGAS